MNIQFRLNSEKFSKVQRIQVSTINQNNKGTKRNLGNTAILIRKKSETSLDMFYAQSVDFAQKLAASQPKKFYVGFAIERSS